MTPDIFVRNWVAPFNQDEMSEEGFFFFFFSGERVVGRGIEIKSSDA